MVLNIIVKTFEANIGSIWLIKKKTFIKLQILKTLEKNNLSFGLDDQYYSIKEFHKTFSSFKKPCEKNYVLKYLNSTNIGNVKIFKL